MAQAEAVMRAALEAANRADAAGVAALTAEDLRFVNPATGPTDRAGMRGFHSALFAAFPDIHYRVDRLTSCGDMVVAECTVTGTQQGEFLGLPPSGRAIELPVAFIVDVEGDRLQVWHAYFDTGTLLRQLGALPEPEAAAAAG